MITRVFNSYFIRTTKIAKKNIDFLDLLRTPTGSHIPITSQEKQSINKKIDIKMQQLEDTGLSKQQILLCKSQKGIPLALDPFFQFLKNNKLAREVYLKKSDRFTVQKVIDIALRQDIGQDPSYSRTKKTGAINPKGRAQFLGNLQERIHTSFDPESYYSNKQTTVEKLYDELKPHQLLKHIFKPINKYERMKTHLRRLRKYDIHWRNVQLLRQFLTPHGNIKNSVSNCLSKHDQKKVTKAIKTARDNSIIPHYGKILPPNRKNVTNLDDEVKELGLQNINLDFGYVYYSRSRSMDSVQVQEDYYNDLDNRKELLEKKSKSFQIWLQQREKQPEKELINSQKYARSLKQKQLSENPAQALEDQQKIALKNITGLHQKLKQSKFIPSNDQESKNSYENRKQKVRRQLQKNPFKISQILIEEKAL